MIVTPQDTGLHFADWKSHLLQLELVHHAMTGTQYFLNCF